MTERLRCKLFGHPEWATCSATHWRCLRCNRRVEQRAYPGRRVLQPLFASVEQERATRDLLGRIYGND